MMGNALPVGLPRDTFWTSPHLRDGGRGGWAHQRARLVSLPRAPRILERHDHDVIYLGIDDTDTLDSPGTNQLARRIAGSLPPGFVCQMALRHQLLFDPRIPYTSKNGSASLLVIAERGHHATELLPTLRHAMREWCVPGSDPGLCVAEHVHREVIGFAQLCQLEPVQQEEARTLAAAHGIHLEGFGDTEDGVIGALAAVGLLASGNDGRVVHLAGWEWPDPFDGWQPLARIHERGVTEVREAGSNAPVSAGLVDVGKQLRPSYRGGRVVLFVEAVDSDGPHSGEPRWRALELT